MKIFEMLLRGKTFVEWGFTRLFRKCIPKERNAIEVGTIGSTIVFVASALFLFAQGFDLNDNLFQIICCGGSVAGFLLFKSIHGEV
jgi:hypothetical protein